MRAVIKFSKSEAVKYISHLDVLRMFQRALMRSGLKTAYSEGYHPHMLLSFALAAPVGVASSCEYAEVYFEYPMFCEEIKQRLGATMPGGCEVLDVLSWMKNIRRLCRWLRRPIISFIISRRRAPRWLGACLI